MSIPLTDEEILEQEIQENRRLSRKFFKKIFGNSCTEKEIDKMVNECAWVSDARNLAEETEKVARDKRMWPFVGMGRSVSAPAVMRVKYTDARIEAERLEMEKEELMKTWNKEQFDKEVERLQICFLNFLKSDAGQNQLRKIREAQDYKLHPPNYKLHQNPDSTPEEIIEARGRCTERGIRFKYVFNNRIYK